MYWDVEPPPPIEPIQYNIFLVGGGWGVWGLVRRWGLIGMGQTPLPLGKGGRGGAAFDHKKGPSEDGVCDGQHSLGEPARPVHGDSEPSPEILG